MLSQLQQAAANLAEARILRLSGATYRDIRQRLRLSSAQICHIRRVLKREKAARTRLRAARPQATDRDLPVGQSALPPGLRQRLTAAGYKTLGDLSDRLADPDFPAFETLLGIGPHKARLICELLDQFDLLAGPADLPAAVARIFPEFD